MTIQLEAITLTDVQIETIVDLQRGNASAGEGTGYKDRRRSELMATRKQLITGPTFEEMLHPDRVDPQIRQQALQAREFSAERSQ